MPTECSRDLFGYEAVEGRQVVAAFDGGAGHLGRGCAAARGREPGDRLGATAGAAASPTAARQELVEHSVETMLMQRICGIALGYEDLVDHDELRHDPVLATLVGKLEARRADCAPLAGKSTLNRLEHAPTSALDRYHKIGHDPRAIEGLFVDLFLEAHSAAAGADRPRSGCHRRSAARPPGRAASSTATTTATATCRCTCSAAGICWRPSCGARTSTPRPGAVEEVDRIVGPDPRALATGARSCCAPTRASPATS